jgi:general nucleoside transport system permease protein
MLGWRLERGSAPWWLRALIPVLAILVTFAVTAALLALVRANPFAAFYAMLIEPLSAPVSALEVLVKATPLLLTGAAVLFAFRGGYYNIGAEGQLYAGALAAAWIGQLSLASVLPRPLVLSLMLLGGFAAGLLWALVPALLRTRWNVDEVVTTLLLNAVMLYLINAILQGPWLDPVTFWPQSPRLAPAAEYPVLVPGSRVHLGLLVGVVVIAVLWWVLHRTPFGLKLRATGLNREGARFMGVNVARTVLIAALVSGGIAGLAGVGEVAGIHHRLLEDISPGFGYSGIVIATLGALDPLGAGLAALFIALIDVGGQSVSRQLGIPTFLADLVQATLLLATLALLLLTGYRPRRVAARPARPPVEKLA